MTHKSSRAKKPAAETGEVGEQSSGSFAQQYDPASNKAERLFLYCRLCRRTFPVTFKPRPQKRLKCLCGHESPVSEFDVFRDEAGAKEFAALYDKIYRAAKTALKDAHLKLPPSGKLPQIRDGMEPPSDLVVRDGNLEDMSDINSSYVEHDDDKLGDAAAREERALRDAIDAARDVLERHQSLSNLIEFLYVRRWKLPGALDRVVEACREDIELAEGVVRAARESKRTGRDVRIAFTSFKHLAIVLEEDGDAAGALDVVEQARRLGLKGYDDRAAKLRAAVGEKRASKKSSRSEERLLESSRRHDELAPEADERAAPPPHARDEAPHGLRSDDSVLPEIEIPLDDDDDEDEESQDARRRRRTSKRANKR